MEIPFQRGVTFGFYARRGVYASDWAKAQIAAMKAHNVGHVALIATVFREDSYSSREFLDLEESPGELELARIIDRLHDAGIRVMLRPMLESHDGNGRLQVGFAPDRERVPGKVSDGWKRWFRSVRARTRVFASLARETGCELYGLDSELDGTVHRNDDWREVVAVARDCFDGPITSCHTHRVDFEAELARPDHWFRDLDFLQTSFYHPAEDEPGATAADMAKRLLPVRELYRRIAKAYGKPVMFGECGCTSATGGARTPSGWTVGGRYAPMEQANYLQAVWALFKDEPWFRGLYWWKWDEQNRRANFQDDPAGDKGFTVLGKAAAEVMKRCFAVDRAAAVPSRTDSFKKSFTTTIAT